MKKRTKRILAVSLCCIMVLQAVIIGGFSFSSGAASNGLGVLYENKFDKSFSDMTSSGVWGLETDQRNDGGTPAVSNGAMVMNTMDSVKFNWTAVDGLGAYSTSKVYNFEFDAKVTGEGDGNKWTGKDHTRILYVAFGGWYNQVEINNKDGKLRAGDNLAVSYSSGAFLNKTVHVKISLEGSVVTSIITDASGNEIVSGSRTSSSYTDMSLKIQPTDQAPAMTYLVLRCEDGSVEIDNFKFSVEGFDSTGSTALNIPTGKQAVYENKISYTKDSRTTVKLGANEIFSISDDGIKVCGCKTSGTYKTGTYDLKVYVNPLQQMMYVEITLPDGGILRRGTYTMLGGNTVDVSSSLLQNGSDAKVSYEDISANDYQFVQVEPSESGFGAYLYNLVTSFDDATSTRNFAWTVSEVFLGDESFALKYREKGTTAWKQVDAIKRAENTNIVSENYYEASIKGLKADTEYEYKIGIKDSSDEQGDWTKSYYFTTAKKDIKDFSFVAVGDTQSLAWGGDTQSNKGYKYAMAAIEEAMQEAPDAAFILNAGDVTDWGDNLQYWNWYFKTLGEYGPSVPHFATQGNHDAWTNDQNNHFSLHFNHPDNGATAFDAAIAGQATGKYGKVLATNYKETVYSYDYGEAHFIVLNSGAYSADDIHILNAQRKWLEEDLKANADARWTIILVHEAVYHRLGGNESRPWLHDVIEEYGVDLVIQGHSHLVTRTYPMKDGKIVTKTAGDVIEQGIGTVYTTIGSTTLNHDSLGNPNVEECMTILTPDNLQPSYTVVSVNEDRLVMTVKQLNGYVLDEFTITADPNYVPPENGDDGDNGNGDDGNIGGNENGGNTDGNGGNTDGNGGNNSTNDPQGDNTQKPAPSSPATSNTEDEGGCGSSIGGAAVIAVAIASLGIGFSFKKKD